MVQENSGALLQAACMASRRQPGNKSLLRSVAPVLGGDASSCDDVVCQRDVACGVDVERRGVHVFVDHDAAVVGVEAGVYPVRVDDAVDMRVSSTSVEIDMVSSTRGSEPRCRTGSLRRDRRRHRRTGAAVARARRRPSRWARRDWRDRRPPHSRSGPLPMTTLAGNVDVVDGDAANQLDVVTDEPAGAVQIERPEDLRGRMHRNVGVLAAERLGSVQPCRTAADGDETWCHHTSWVPLRRVDRPARQRFVTFAEPSRTYCADCKTRAILCGTICA